MLRRDWFCWKKGILGVFGCLEKVVLGGETKETDFVGWTGKVKGSENAFLFAFVIG